MIHNPEYENKYCIHSNRQYCPFYIYSEDEECCSIAISAKNKSSDPNEIKRCAKLYFDERKRKRKGYK